MLEGATQPLLPEQGGFGEQMLPMGLSCSSRADETRQELSKVLTTCLGKLPVSSTDSERAGGMVVPGSAADGETPGIGAALGPSPARNSHPAGNGAGGPVPLVIRPGC